jgi:CubicO group peptidase (beta-lactamase class C family)
MELFHRPRLMAIAMFFTLLGACSTPAFAQGEKIVKAFLEKNKVPGMFVAVVRQDSILYQNGFGMADVQKAVPLTANTCMELGSISKVFTAEAIYDLHHAGLLSIQDPITKYLRGAPASWAGISIQQLLSHTSGIPNYLLDPRYYAAAYFTNSNEPAAEQFFSTVKPDSMVRLFYSLPAEFPPGFTWSYSNTGYYLLGKIAEAVTRKPFFDHVKEKITAPLQMVDTKANELAAQEQCLAQGYFLRDHVFAPARMLHSNYAFSAGAWATTGQDMIAYLKAVHKRNLPTDKAGMDWRKPPVGEHLPFTYNAGRFYTTFRNMQIISHNGGTPGFSSSWIYAVEKNISVIVLMNRQDYAPIDQLAWDILSSFEPSLKYPTRLRPGATEKTMAQKVLAVLVAVEESKPLPSGLARPLEHFLESENGKGYWKWYFDRGFPKYAYCVDVEKIGRAKLYRFLLPLSKETVYRLCMLVNEKDEIMQIRWW